jgi:hypothetical protein
MGQWQFLSAVDFERSENDILLVLELREFLHSQGQIRHKLLRLLVAKSTTEGMGNIAP